MAVDDVKEEEAQFRYYFEVKMIQTAGPAPPPPADLMAELRVFITGATRSSRRGALDANLARTALTLLRTLPAAREAVLEYFCTLFDEAVSKHITQLEVGPVNGSNIPGLSPQEEATISEVHKVLSDFVSSSPAAWAPIISTWALQLLGELSSRYTEAAQISGGLNESLQLWMSCRATRTLIDITTLCLSCLMHSDTESCIHALLDTCVIHSPYFDWVVAHVGGCFPKTVLHRVLTVGLHDFCSQQMNIKAPKLTSVVGILSHLEGTHQADTRRALLQLFQWSLMEEPHCDTQTTLEKDSTVPFLLRLASMSPALLRALSTDVLQTLTPKVLATLSLRAPSWLAQNGGRSDTEGLLLHLSLQSHNSGPTILKLLLDCADPPDPESVPITAAEVAVHTNARLFLEMMMQELSLLVHSSDVSVPFLDSLRQDLYTLLPLLLSTPKRGDTALRLLLLMGHQSASVRVTSVSFLLSQAKTNEQLAMLVCLLESRGAGGNAGNARRGLSSPWSSRGDGGSVDTLRLALERSLAHGTDAGPNKIVEPRRLWLNLKTLLKWEICQHPALRERPILRRQPVRRAITSLLPEASNVLVLGTRNSDLSHIVANVLEVALDADTSRPLELKSALRLGHAAVTFFLCSLEDPDESRCVTGCRLACSLLSRLCARSSAARQLALRSLLEHTLFQGPFHLLGGTPNSHFHHSHREEQTEFRLLQENLKQGLSWVVAQSHSSVFHAGVIGTGLRRPPEIESCPLAVRQRATQQVIDAVRACCSGSPDAAISVALLLVELVSPDVMYNGLPWPEEDACKATVERDCAIRRTLERTPLLWELLWWVAWHRPALCYCSVLLRAATATLTAQWGSLGGAGSGGSMVPTVTTVKLLSLLALSQLLPAPLASLRDVVPHLKPSEVVQLLRDCVWSYMRDHVPSPALFTRDASGLMWRDPTLNHPAPQYSETMRLIMQANVTLLGPLYAQLFVP